MWLTHIWCLVSPLLVWFFTWNLRNHRGDGSVTHSSIMNTRNFCRCIKFVLLERANDVDWGVVKIVSECEYNALNVSVRIVQKNWCSCLSFLAFMFLWHDLRDQLCALFCWSLWVLPAPSLLSDCGVGALIRGYSHECAALCALQECYKNVISNVEYWYYFTKKIVPLPKKTWCWTHGR